jgi:HKD family nuclease
LPGGKEKLEIIMEGSKKPILPLLCFKIQKGKELKISADAGAI